jgi:electron transport complex protein RnfG
MLVPSISRNALLLASFAALTTAAIAATFLGTRERIADNRHAAEERALLEVVPRSRHDNSMLHDTVTIDDSALLGLYGPRQAHIARLRGEPVAVILPAIARDGYGGDIELIVGINVDGSIAGVRVLAHKETPGLGDKVSRSKSDWIESFTGKSLGNPPEELWGVKKDQGIFDQFTGATITPRAVTATVKRALQYFSANRSALLATSTGDNADE